MAAAGRRGRIDRISGKWQEQQLYFFSFLRNTVPNLSLARWSLPLISAW
jgi:hypothetical protein